MHKFMEYLKIYDICVINLPNIIFQEKVLISRSVIHISRLPINTSRKFANTRRMTQQNFKI